MKQLSYTLDYQVYDSEKELPGEDHDLLLLAREATKSSYAPYSHYHVGTAVKLSNGIIVKGSNQENVSFPAGLCAERTAMFAAASEYPGITVEAIAITAVTASFEVNEPVSPCGICRQVIVEYEMKQNRKIRVILGGHSGEVFIFNGMESLLPLAFHEKGLMKERDA